jgi:ribosomal protein RSM22 (predicted rRNA methylase)
MRLPPELNAVIQEEVEKIPQAELSQAVDYLTQRYKAGSFSSPAITTPAHRAAYLAVRFPATYAADRHVFAEIHRLAPEAPIRSLLDLGAGPGTSAHAAAEVFPSLASVTLVEVDGAWLETGQRLSRKSWHPAIRNSRWLQQDLKAGLALPPQHVKKHHVLGPTVLEEHDLVVLSYTLNELWPAAAGKAVLQAWQHAREFLAIVEPGTMRGFGFIHAVRSQLIQAGAYVLAPCPHTSECPMAAAGDWCHFAQRVERTSMHRRLKAGALGYEDEKFSYIIAGRKPVPIAPARIVRHPQKHGRHVQLVLCTVGGLETRMVSKAHKENYKLARKTAWGDEWG